MQNDTIVEGPNPKPLPSHLPEEAEALISVPEKLHVDKDVRDAFQKFRKAANYIAAGKAHSSLNGVAELRLIVSVCSHDLPAR
jgi:xylulose-5-phosphate/fructose-6-phosphate phosphoketolase